MLQVAGLLGCRVLAWEPVSLYRAYLLWALAANNLTHLVEVRAAAVGPTHGGILDIALPK